LVDPVLLLVLNDLRAPWEGAKEWHFDLLEEAIVACTPKAIQAVEQESVD
jgi:hypothetical protein